MRKLAFINFDMTTRGGSQQVMANIVNTLCDRYEIHVISLIAEKDCCAYELDERITYCTILSYRARIRQTILKGRKVLKKYLKEIDAEQIFFVGAYAGLCGGIMTRSRKARKIFCDHGALLNQWNELPARTMRTLGSRYSDVTVVLTEQSRQAYIEKLKRSPERIRTIYNWIDNEIIEKSGVYEEMSTCLLTAGRFSHEKGYDMLVEVAKRLYEKTRDFTWEIYGEGDMFDEIKKRIQEYGLENHVILKGLTNHMYDCYKGHAMYVLTSYREGLPLVLLEAKANMLPLISFDIVSGPAEIIHDGKDGVLIPPYDLDKMAETIADLLADKEKRKRMSAHCPEGMELFSKDTICRQWIDLIEEG